MNFRKYGLGLFLVLFLSSGHILQCPAVFASLKDSKGAVEAEDPAGTELIEAEQLLDKKKWNEAAQLFRAQIKKNPKSVPVIIGLSTALVHLGQREESLYLLIQASSWAKNGSRKQLIERVRVISRLFLTNRTFQIFQDGMNLILVKKFRTSRERFEKALVEEPDNLEILIRIGQCFVLEGASDKAIEKLQLAKKMNPFEPEVRLWLGKALSQKGKFSEALPDLRMAYDELDGSELAPVWLAETYSALNQNNAALRILEQDIKQWPFHIVSLLTAARLRSQSSHVEAPSLWAARKNLQVAMSRLSEYRSPSLIQVKNELSLDLTRPQQDLKTEIQRLMLQVEGRLNDINSRR